MAELAIWGEGTTAVAHARFRTAPAATRESHFLKVTLVSIKKLQAVHAAAHPGAKLERVGTDEVGSEALAFGVKSS